MQPKTIKSKNNDCGTVPGYLVLVFFNLANTAPENVPDGHDKDTKLY